MSFELPTSIERELNLYAKAEHLTLEEAAVRLIRTGLESSRIRVTEADIATLRTQVPLLAFGEGLPAEVFGSLELSSSMARARA